MAKFIWHDGGWVNAVRDTRPPMFPSIIRDGMQPLQHQGDGRVYDSKSTFRRVTRELGYIEVGNEDVVAAKPKLRPVREDILRAWEMVEQGYQSPPVANVDDGDFRDIPMKVYNAPESD